MFVLYEEVKVKNTGMVGTIIDSYKVDGRTMYYVEGNERGKFQTEQAPEAYPIHVCKESEIEPVLSTM